MHKKENSYGIIPLRKQQGEWQVLLIKHRKGHWAFPKGHPEKSEKPEETAVREFTEETNLKVVSFLNIASQKEHYFFRSGTDIIDKTVIYFVAEVFGEIVLHEEEISDYKWLSFDEAQKQITFPQAKELCAQVRNNLRH
jgi:bis(5'-nucleosidyl)-tetraphosphatase